MPYHGVGSSASQERWVLLERPICSTSWPSSTHAHLTVSSASSQERLGESNTRSDLFSPCRFRLSLPQTNRPSTRLRTGPGHSSAASILERRDHTLSHCRHCFRSPGTPWLSEPRSGMHKCERSSPRSQRFKLRSTSAALRCTGSTMRTAEQSLKASSLAPPTVPRRQE